MTIATHCAACGRPIASCRKQPAWYRRKPVCGLTCFEALKLRPATMKGWR